MRATITFLTILLLTNFSYSQKSKCRVEFEKSTSKFYTEELQVNNSYETHYVINFQCVKKKGTDSLILKINFYLDDKALIAKNDKITFSFSDTTVVMLNNRPDAISKKKAVTTERNSEVGIVYFFINEDFINLLKTKKLNSISFSGACCKLNWPDIEPKSITKYLRDIDCVRIAN